MIYKTNSPEETYKVALELSKKLKIGDVVCLDGDLGVGKTMFTKGLCEGLLVTDYVTSPVTNIGKIIFGIGCGAITVFIRFKCGYPEGVSFAILIMNLFVWYIDKCTKPKNFGGGKK